MKRNLNAVLMFVCLLLVDFIFYIIAFDSFSFYALMRMLMIDVFLAFFFSWILSKTSKKTETIISFIVILLFGIYAYIELEFKNFLTTYYSFKAVADGGFRVSTFVLYFIKNAKWYYYLTLIPAFIYLPIKIKFIKHEKIHVVYLVLSLIGAASLVLSFIIGEPILKEAVNSQENLDVIISHAGIDAFLFEDISSIFIKQDNSLVIDDIPQNEIEDVVVEEPTEEKSYKRLFDDSRWRQDYENETEDTIKTIDNYLLNRSIDDMNDMTGKYEGYNFIYFLVESLDYMGIDEQLTPTIWKMMNDGYYFKNHYTPVFSCGTGDSEFAAMNSLMPYGSSCTVYSVTQNNLNSSIGGLFKSAGYKTYEFHNWDDTFYKRSELSKAYGIDTYMDINDLDFDIVYGWQSDSILAEKTMQYYVNDDKFFVYYVTSTMHWPYDEDSYYGNYYIDQINEVHPDYPMAVKRYISKTMEFDKMLETLLKGLEEAGKLDNTVFCFWPDHHPFNISTDYIRKYTTVIDRYAFYSFYKSPLIIYNATEKGEVIDSVCSTLDQLPTVANLFNLNYDPRLYIGNDIFNDNCRVVMPSGDWINNKGAYIYSSGEFVPFNENDTMSDEEIEAITTEVRNTARVSRAMVANDYFKKRAYVINPRKKN